MAEARHVRPGGLAPSRAFWRRKTCSSSRLPSALEDGSLHSHRWEALLWGPRRRRRPCCATPSSTSSATNAGFSAPSTDLSPRARAGVPFGRARPTGAANAQW